MNCGVLKSTQKMKTLGKGLSNDYTKDICLVKDCPKPFSAKFAIRWFKVSEKNNLNILLSPLLYLSCGAGKLKFLIKVWWVN